MPFYVFFSDEIWVRFKAGDNWVFFIFYFFFMGVVLFPFNLSFHYPLPHIRRIFCACFRQIFSPNLSTGSLNHLLGLPPSPHRIFFRALSI